MYRIRDLLADKKHWQDGRGCFPIGLRKSRSGTAGYSKKCDAVQSPPSSAHSFLKIRLGHDAEKVPRATLAYSATCRNPRFRRSNMSRNDSGRLQSVGELRRRRDGERYRDAPADLRRSELPAAFLFCESIHNSFVVQRPICTLRLWALTRLLQTQLLGRPSGTWGPDAPFHPLASQ